MSFPHHLALFKDHSCLLLPTIARHCPLLPAKKMSQALVASQYGRGSRGPGRVPRAAPRQPGCTAEQTNHEPRPFLPRGASRREFRGLHESRLFLRACARAAQPKPPSGPLRLPASHCFPVHRCSPLFTIVHDCSPLFTIVHPKILFGASLHVSPRGEAKWVRGPSGLGASRAEEKGASRLTRAGMLEQYVEHGKQAQRSHGGRIVCFDRRVVRNAGWCPRAARTAVPAARSLLRWARSRGMARLSRGLRGGEWGVSQCQRIVSRTRSALRRAPFAADPVGLRTPWAVAKAQ